MEPFLHPIGTVYCTHIMGRTARGPSGWQVGKPFTTVAWAAIYRPVLVAIETLLYRQGHFVKWRLWDSFVLLGARSRGGDLQPNQKTS